MPDYRIPALYVAVRRVLQRRMKQSSNPVMPDGSPCENGFYDGISFWYSRLNPAKRIPVYIGKKVSGSANGVQVASAPARSLEGEITHFIGWLNKHKISASRKNVLVISATE
jgi:hypothetical protein